MAPIAGPSGGRVLAEGPAHVRARNTFRSPGALLARYPWRTHPARHRHAHDEVSTQLIQSGPGNAELL
jgi:hypothetical protein